jgi:hypothetical protein
LEEEFFESILIYWMLSGIYVLRDLTGGFFDFFIRRRAVDSYKRRGEMDEKDELLSYF